MSPAGATATKRTDVFAVEVGPGVVPPELLSSASTSPEGYAPPISGTVEMRALIDENGRVVDTALVSSPDQRLTRQATKMLRDRRYTPAQRDGAPIAVWWRATFRFLTPADEIAAMLACDPATFPTGDVEVPDAGVTLPVILRGGGIPKAVRYKRGGTAKLECVINVCGRVTGCKVLETSNPEVAKAAIDAMFTRIYRPATRNGKPIAIYFAFRLDYR
jgi:hypothetical protein